MPGLTRILGIAINRLGQPTANLSAARNPHQWLLNDRTNYSVVVQLGSSYRSENHILGDNFKDASRDWHLPSHHPDSIEKRRARREASFEKWKDAGDRVFCHSGRFGHDLNHLKA
uniref:HNH nuclease domain-containing protein n=1 Tax=Fusarium oxysporum (strain Fo5176) TaxID=660025 RepID=A0A0D2XQR7_FUSOF